MAVRLKDWPVRAGAPERCGSAKPMSQVDIGWLAGIIEGEGTFIMEGKYPKIRVVMSDPDTIERLRAVSGAGTVGPAQPASYRNSKLPLYVWRVGAKREIARILLAIYPMMSARRKAKIAILVDSLDAIQARS